MTDRTNSTQTEYPNSKRLLEENLTFNLIGCFIQVRKDYGLGHKESIYQKALEEELEDKKIEFKREQSIPVKSVKTNKTIGFYKPDFIVYGKIIIEIEVFPGSFTSEHIKRLYDYLKNSTCEIGFLVNFGKIQMQYKRIILTNDHKNTEL